MGSLYLESGLWNRNTWSYLNTMRREGIACDVTLCSEEDVHVPAHLCIIVAASPYLKSLFNGIYDINRSTVVKLTGVSTPILEAILDFIYTGSFQVGSLNVDSLVKTAKMLQMKDLQLLCKHIKEKQAGGDESMLLLENSLWNKTIWLELNNQRDGSRYCNLAIELPCGNKLEAHACLLLAASGYFKRFIPTDQIEKGFSVCLRISEMEIAKSNMTTVLDFVYLGSLVCSQNNFNKVSELVSFLKMDDMKVLLSNFARKYKLNEKPAETEVNVVSQEENVENIVNNNVEIVESTEEQEINTIHIDADQPLADGQLLQLLDAAGNVQAYCEETAEVDTQIEQTVYENETLIVPESVEDMIEELEVQDQRNPIRQADGKGALCPFCMKDFRKPCEVRRHIFKHTGERPYMCKTCGKRFKFKGNAMSHARLHTGIKPHVCGLCGKRFARGSDLQIHRRTHNKERPYKCPHCPKAFNQSSNRLTHVKYVHEGAKRPNEEGLFECLQCGKHFTSLSNLHSHKRRHLNPVRHPCDKCQATFVSSSGLKRHLRRGACEKVIAQRNKVKMLKEEFPDQPIIDKSQKYFGVVQCKDCQTTFSNVRCLERHKRRGACEKVLHRQKLLANTSNYEMLTKAEGVQTIKLKCKDCDSEMSSLSSLSRHKKRGACQKNQNMKIARDFYNSGILPPEIATPVVSKESLPSSSSEEHFVCLTCSKRFESEKELKNHQDNELCKKTSLRPASKRGIRCPKCHLAFKNLQLLQEHATSMECKNMSSQDKRKETKEKSDKTTKNQTDNNTNKDKSVKETPKDSSISLDQSASEKVKRLIEAANVIEEARKRIRDQYLKQAVLQIQVLQNPKDDKTQLKSVKIYQCFLCQAIVQGEDDFDNHWDMKHKNQKVPTNLMLIPVDTKVLSNLDIIPVVKSEQDDETAVQHHSAIQLSIKPNENSSKRVKAKQAATYSCRHCSATFKVYRLLKSHMIEEHSNEKGVLDFTCNVCSTPFYSKPGLLTHLNRYKNKSCLENRKVFIHRKAPVFKCFRCNKKFTSGFALKVHISSVHGSVRNSTDD